MTLLETKLINEDFLMLEEVENYRFKEALRDVMYEVDNAIEACFKEE